MVTTRGVRGSAGWGRGGENRVGAAVRFSRRWPERALRMLRV